VGERKEPREYEPVVKMGGHVAAQRKRNRARAAPLFTQRPSSTIVPVETANSLWCANLER
jgi:hypothetical protein